MKRALIAWLGVAALAALSLRADEPSRPATASPTAQAGESAVNQEILAKQFHDFEQSLLRLAQRLAASSKPEERERAATLKKAIEMASNSGVDNKFDKLIQILRNSKALSLQELRDAMEQNRMVANDIKAILALLLADNRDAELKRERQRIADLIKRLDGLIRQQKIVRAQTEAGKVDKAPLGKAQEKVTKETGELARSMEKRDAGGKPGSPEKGEPKKGGQSGGKPSEKPGEPKEGQGQDGKKGPQSEGQQEPTPGKKQVQEANRLQKQAEEKIRQDKKNEASKHQDRAIAELEKARQRLEEILRQLREEEQERLLAALQQRCERMLQMQIEVYEGTVRVDHAVAENPDHRPTRAEEQRALQLSDREEKIVLEANKAIQVLEAEGSAVAFPEVFTQVRDDMQNVARRLGKADAGSVTQVIEQDVINTLKEMIEALKKARKKLQESRSQPPPSSGQPPPQSLIDLLAELKMIRAMQVRVNTRTRVYAERYTGEQAADTEIQRELANLAQRQQRIFEITYNIYKGNNR